eukprot:13177308-Alexandrium_andersonii.AAC.1
MSNLAQSRPTRCCPCVVCCPIGCAGDAGADAADARPDARAAGHRRQEAPLPIPEGAAER